MTTTVRVWDLPTRLFHWLLVILFGVSWWSAENRAMEWHVLSGTVLLGLVFFRLIWGLVGGSTARFASFVRRPRRVAAYLRGSETAALGHNPLGGYSVIAMLLLLCVQIGTGLFATDIDGLDSGPLAYLVSFDQGRSAAEVHDAAFNVLLTLVGLHVLAIAFYVVIRRRNLVRPMVTGTRRDEHCPEGALVPARPLVLVLAALAAAGLAWWTSSGLIH